ncbi:uncharacterized protein [Montipora capricornis]|uniref:uncharacterized protein isoform X2 n=1 Tax=Montipora capricornis TaxID=246305 RepID=UPI0035F10CA8
MNQQFLPIFHPTPKFVPVVVRSNAPVGFTGSYNPSTCYHIPVFPGHASPDTKFTPTTSKTRRDLEHLGSPTDDKTLSEVIFELAAQKNGIRIGSVPNIGGVHVAKQTASNSLEEFKKIAQRNGITVYQAGSNHETESISTDDDSKGMLSAVNKEPTVDTEEDVSEIEKFAEIFVAEVQNEMDVNMANGDYLEKKAGKSDIKVKDSTDLVKRSSCCSNQSGDFEEAICVNSNYCVVDSKPCERLPAINDHVSKATNKTTIEDSQIAAFQKIASQKGIKVGMVSNEINFNDYYSSVDAGDSVSVSEVNKAKVVTEALDLTEQDLKIARFQEMARLNGIKVGGGEVDTNGRKISSNSCPEYFDSGSGESSQQNECYLDAERDPQILRFQELAWMNGIKVGTTSAPSPSYSSLSSCDSDDQSSSQFVDKWPIMVQNCLDRKSDAFQEATERIGIKHKETSAIAKSVANACGLVAPFASASAEASTQTEVAVHVDCHTQTQDKDSEISRLSTGVQVSATKEAFQEEHLLWKLDDDNKVEAEAALCYKDLYLSESKKAEKLGADLQDKKDLLLSLRHNHKRVMDEIKEELNTKLKECEELKKELKANRRLKENEIKRISKELKSRQEELEASHANLQIKEVVVESLRQIAQEQTAKIKVLEEELQDLKQASSKVQENQECKACVKEQDTENLEGNVDNRNKVQNDDDDDDDDDNGWTVIARKKSKSPLKKQKNTKDIKSGSISQLCEIDLDDCIKRESIGHVFSDPKMHSIDTGSVSIDSTSQVSLEDDTNCRDSTLVSKVGESNGECQYHAVDEDNTTGGTNKFTSSCPQTLQQDVFCNVDNNAKVQRVAEGSSAQQASLLSYPSTLPSQPHPFPSVPLEVFTQYLSNQLQTPRSVPQVKNSRSVCRPPGLNTEPVPEGEIPCQQTTPLSAPAGKFSSFDKLMVALQKRFPSKDRQELIVYLKKAKAACGAAGFKGMQILDVVKCVEETVELKENKMP